ncbi:MAG: DNRLRE domain-containing protein [Phycisphaerae bacterium]|nr:DNRLRE domain-containing protein [Phycisphaerae bacterium]
MPSRRSSTLPRVWDAAALLVLLAFLATAQALADSGRPAEALTARPGAVELLDYRTQASKTYANSDGTRTWSSVAGSVHYQDRRTGRWEEIDVAIRPLTEAERSWAEAPLPTSALPAVSWAMLAPAELLQSHGVAASVGLRALIGQGERSWGFREAAPRSPFSTSGSLFVYGMTRNTYKTYFAADGSSPVLARFVAGDSWSACFGVEAGRPGPVTVHENRIVYHDILPGADLRFTANADELREEIILHRQPDRAEWLFPVYVENVRVEQGAHDTLEFIDSRTGRRVWFIPKPFMYDMSGERSEAVCKQLVKVGGRVFLRVEADAGWLESGGRSYPVTIDPTFSGQPPAHDGWCQNYSGSSRWYGATSLQVRGLTDPNRQIRSYMRWDMSSIPAGATANNASNSVRLTLYRYSQNGTSGDVDMYRLTGAWTGGTINWFSQPASTYVARTSVAASNGLKTWSYNGSTGGMPTSNGVMIRDRYENTGDRIWLFYSADYYTGATNRPKLEIDYTDPCTPPAAPTIGVATANSTNQITWGWTRAAGATGETYMAYDASSGGTLKWTSASQAASCAESSLATNTLYGSGAGTGNQRYLATFQDCESSTRLALPGRYTLQASATTPTFGTITTASIVLNTTGPTNLTAGSSGVIFRRNGLTNLAKVQALTTTDSSLTANTSYSYTAWGVNGDNVASAESGVASRFTLANAPTYGTSGNVTISCDAGQTKTNCTAGQNIVFTFNNAFGSGAANVGQFGCLWNQTAGDPASWSGEQLWTSGTTLTKQTGTAGQSYYLHIRSYNNDTTKVVNTSVLNLGPYTVPAPAVPDAPSEPAAYPAATAITWGWKDNSSDETGFKVYAGQGASAPSGVTHTTTANITSWSGYTGRNVNTQHAMQVAATGADGDSTKTANLPVYTLNATPTAPTLSDVGMDTLRVITTGPVNLAGEAGVVFNQNGIDLAPSLALVKDISGLIANTQYTFKAASTNGDGVRSLGGNGPHVGAKAGTVTMGATDTPWGSGCDRAISLTASTENYIDIGTSADASNSFDDFTGGLTIELWAKPTSVAGCGFVGLNVAAGSTTDVVDFITNMGTPGILQCNYRNNTTSNAVYTPSVVVTTGSWQHLAVTIDAGGLCNLYRNGVVQAVNRTNGSLTLRNVSRTVNRIGRTQSNLNFTFGGGLDEVAIYNHALSAARLAAHYRAPSSSDYVGAVMTDAPIAYWRLGDTGDDTFADSSGGYGPSAATYTLSNAPTYGTSGHVTIQCGQGQAATCVDPGSDVTFTFNNSFGDGPANVGQLEYLWDTAAEEPTNWAGATLWTSGAFRTLSVGTSGSYYLHIRSYNNDETKEVNPSVLNLGPYTVGAIPAAPHKAAASDVGPDVITWNWSDVADAQYRLWTAASGGTQVGGTLSANSYTETGLNPGTLYARYVEAFNDCGTSARTALDPVNTMSRFCVENGGFDVGEFVNGVAPSWTKLDYVGTGSYSAGTGSGNYYSSPNSQRITFGQNEEAYVYQKYNLIPGRGYTLSVRVKIYETSQTRARIRVDPEGGVNPWASGIIGAESAHQNWELKKTSPEVVTVGAAGVVTLFLGGYTSQYVTGDSWVQVDDAYIQPAAPTSTGGSATICQGQSANITASGGFAGSSSELKWYTQPNGEGILVGTGSPLSVSPSSSTTYYPRWEAGSDCGSCCASGDGTPVTVTVQPTPAAPSNPGWIDVTTSAISWTWQDNSSNETGFKVYAAQGVGEPTYQTTVAADATFWDGYTGLDANRPHSFRVAAAGSGSCDSAPTPLITRYTLIQTPTGVVFDGVTETSIDAAPSGTLSNLAADSSGVQTANTTTGISSGWLQNQNAWTSSGLTPNTQYGFVARARNGDGVETTDSPATAGYTLARAGRCTSDDGSTGNVWCTNATTNSWYGQGKQFIFANPAGFGTSLHGGNVWRASSLEYKWTGSATESWASPGTPWSAGTIEVTPTVDGDWYLHVRALNEESVVNNDSTVVYGPFMYDSAAPDVTVNQAVGQPDPASVLPILFTVVFTETVVDFEPDDVTFTGTAAGITHEIDGEGAQYQIRVTAVETPGTIVAHIPVGACTDLAGNLNTASTSTDNSVTYSTAAEPTIVSWQSVRTHGGATGNAGITLQANGNMVPCSESRRYGIQTLVIEFNEEMEVNGSLDDAVTLVGYGLPPEQDPVDYTSELNVPTLLAGSRKLAVTVKLNGRDSSLANRKRYTFTLDGGSLKSKSSGLPMAGDLDCQVRSLCGDVNNSGKVLIDDLVAIKLANRSSVTQANCRLDVNLDGEINIIDMALANYNYGSEAP